MTPSRYENILASCAALRSQLWHHLVVQEQQLRRLEANRNALRDACDGTKAQLRELRTFTHRSLPTATPAQAPTTPPAPATPCARPQSRDRGDRFRRRRPKRLERRNDAQPPRDFDLSPLEERLRRFFRDDEAALPALRLPAGLHFADLHLRVHAWTRRLLFLPSPLGEFALRNGLDPERVLADEDKSCELIAAWYVTHIEEGGDPDPAVEAAFRWLDPQ